MIFKNLNQPKEENVNQIQLYMHFFKVPKGILLYVNKDTQELKEFLIERNPGIAKNLLKELADLKKKIDSDIIPSRIFSYPEDWQCKYCQFREVCEMANGGEVKWNDFKIKIEKTA